MPRRTVVESTRKETALEALHLALKRAGRRQRPRPGKPGFTAVEQTMRWWRADWEERSSEQRQTDLFSATSWAKVRQRREAHPDVDTELLPLYVDQLAALLEEATLLPVAAESAAAKSKRAASAVAKPGTERSRGAAAVAHGFAPAPAGAEVGDEVGMALRAAAGAEPAAAAAALPPHVFTKNRMLRVRADSEDYDARAGKRAAIAWVEQAPSCCPPDALCPDFPSCFSPPSSSAPALPCCSKNWFNGDHPIVNHDGHHDILVGGRLYHLRPHCAGAADAADCSGAADGKQMLLSCGGHATTTPELASSDLLSCPVAGSSTIHSNAAAMAMTPGGGGGCGSFVWEDHGGVELLDDMLLDSLEAELAGDLACDGALRPPSPPPGVGATSVALAGVPPDTPAPLAPPAHVTFKQRRDARARLASVSELPLCAKHEGVLADPAKLPAEKPCSSCSCSRCGATGPHAH